MADYEKNDVTARTLSPAGEAIYKTGNLEFVAEQGDNGGKPTYQEASGAPVEAHSPLPAREDFAGGTLCFDASFLLGNS